MKLHTQRVVVMGILNITPDSFSDGGRFLGRDAALRQAERLLAEGADIIDIGGESTRPGAAAVSLDAELERVIPMVELLRTQFDACVSVDTSKAGVMQAALAAGASVINDVRALQEPGALEVCAAASAYICLMHMQGQPRTMQQAPIYSNVVAEVQHFLAERVAACEAAGIARERLIIDPGFGFGKSLAHNCELLRELHSFQSLGLPILVGLSRKSMIGALLGERSVGDRVQGSVAAAVVAVLKGARLVRVHDVAATVDALRVVHAVL